MADTLTKIVAASPDDCQEDKDGTDLITTGTLINLLSGSTDALTDVGAVRFNSGVSGGVVIAQGSIIVSAKLSLYVETTTRDDPNMDMYGQLALDPDDFINEGGPVGRTKTAASVAWVATGIGAGRKDSPDISAIVREIIAQPGWLPGNAMVFILWSRSDASSKALQFRARDHASGSTDAAQLIVEFVPPPAAWVPPQRLPPPIIEHPLRVLDF
jgi:hypothetical protein